MKIQLMVTCLGDVLRPDAPKAVVRLLRRIGCAVDFPQSQTCCGQPLFNSGYTDLAREQAKHTIRVFEGDAPVVTPSGSCAAMVKKEFPHLFQGAGAKDKKHWLDRAEDLASRTFEFTDFLVNQLHVLDVGARYEGRVTQHYACHLRLLHQKDEVKKLVEHVQGAEYVDLPRDEQCCGFGGSFAVRYSQISTAMVDNKTACIAQTKADAVVSTDAGCLMNIGGRLRRQKREIEVMHIAELLDRR